MADVPSNVPSGRVVGRFVAFYADGSDEGEKPDEIPLKGSVTLTPSVSYLKWPGLTPPRTAVIQPVVCPIIDGWLSPPYAQTADPNGVVLTATSQPEGLPNRVQWTAKFRLEGATVQPSDVVFNVEEDSITDLTTVLPQKADPGQIVIVSTKDRVLAEDAAGQAEISRAAAVSARNEAQEALSGAVVARSISVSAASSAEASAARAETSVARAEASAARAETSANRAEAIPVTNDGIMASVAQDPDSQFANQLNATIGEKVGALVPAGIVTSPAQMRILRVAEDAPLPPLEDGDVVVRYAVPGETYFTDFTADTIDVAPAGWTPFGMPGDWKVVAEVEAGGGKALRFNSATGVGRWGLAWDALSADPDRGEVEILLRWKCGANTYGPLAIGRAGEDATPTISDAAAGGVQDADTARILRYAGGTLSNAASAPFATVAGNWYKTRFRIEGGQGYLRVWNDADPEPLAWLVEGGVFTGVTGLAGLAITRAGSRIHLIDWVAAATGGRTAVHP